LSWSFSSAIYLVLSGLAVAKSCLVVVVAAVLILSLSAPFRLSCHKAKLPELSNFDLSEANKAKLRSIYRDLSLADGKKVKAFESVTNHDVKAVEYFIKEKFDAYGWHEHKEFIHFALTSQDINNTAVPLSIAEFMLGEYIPKVQGIVRDIRNMAREYASVTMLAKTHGQPATPTRLGKELMVFVERVDDQLALLHQVPFTCKFGGATGGFNAHQVAYPEVDWEKFADRFISEGVAGGSVHSNLKMKRQRYTTQIEHYDKMGALFDTVKTHTLALTPNPYAKP
jgi:adenylosuccinate lyase